MNGFYNYDSNASATKMKSNSAYLVLYEQKHSQPQEDIPIDPQLLNQVKQQNKNYLIYKQIFESNLLFLVQNTVNRYLQRGECDEKTVLNLIDIVLVTVLRLINQTDQANQPDILLLIKSVKQLSDKLHNKWPILKYFQDYNFQTYLIESPESNIRQFAQECL